MNKDELRALALELFNTLEGNILTADMDIEPQYAGLRLYDAPLVGFGAADEPGKLPALTEKDRAAVVRRAEVERRVDGIDKAAPGDEQREEHKSKAPQKAHMSVQHRRILRNWHR